MYLTITTTSYGENPVVETLYFGNGTVTYNGEVYYYVTNLQGDVIAILDDEGNAVVEYTYDAWGNILTTTGSMASTLGAAYPLTYRGYIYDTESGLYYLQSRYYNPEVGRFINADILVSTGQGFLGNNMFAYCGNNPIIRYDPSGMNWLTDFLKGIKEWLEEKQAEAAENEDGTTSYGINLGAAYGLAGSGTVAVTWDNKGNVGIIRTIGGGAGTPSASIAVCGTKTNAPDIYKQKGSGVQIGGSVSYSYLSGGAEFCLFNDPDTGKPYQGLTLVLGAGISSFPVEIHEETTYSEVHGINLYDIPIGIVDIIIYTNEHVSNFFRGK